MRTHPGLEAYTGSSYTAAIPLFDRSIAVITPLNPRLFGLEDGRETIVNLLIHLKSDGYAESTLKMISIRLRQLDRICDINNPLEIKKQSPTRLVQTRSSRVS